MKTFFTDLYLNEIKLGVVSLKENGDVYYNDYLINDSLEQKTKYIYTIEESFKYEIRSNELNCEFGILRQRLIFDIDSAFKNLQNYFENNIIPTYKKKVQGETEVESDPILDFLSSNSLILFKGYINTKIQICQDCLDYLSPSIEKYNQNGNLVINNRVPERFTINRTKKECMIIFYFLHEIDLLESKDRGAFQRFIEQNFNYKNKKGEIVPFRNSDIELSRLIRFITDDLPRNCKGELRAPINVEKDEIFEDLLLTLSENIEDLKELLTTDFDRVVDVWGYKYQRNRYLPITEK